MRSTGRILSVPVGDALLGRVVNPLGEPIDGKGPLGDDRATAASRSRRPGIVSRQPVSEPLQTGIKVIDAMTPDRPRPARAHHRRPQDRQDDRSRSTRSSTSAAQGVKCIYVAIGQKGSTIAQTVATLAEHGALEYTVVVAAPASEPAPFKYLAPYAGCAMGQHWMENGEHALDRLRRPLQAGRGLPPDLAAAAPSARPRGLSRRRLLPPQPPARAGGEALRRDRRRLAHGAADHRDQGRRHLRLHPDQRDLDHRRPDLPRDRPLLLRGPAGDQRRQLGLPGRRRRADQGDEVGRRHAEDRPGPVP